MNKAKTKDGTLRRLPVSLAVLVSTACALPWPPPALAERPKPAAVYQMLVVSSFQGRTKAVALAKRLSSALRLPLADETLRKPPAELRLLGPVLSLHRPKSGRYLLTSYLGQDTTQARQALRRLRRHHRKARLVRREVAAPDSLDETYLAYSQTSVVILGSLKGCKAATRAARALARKTGVSFATRDMVCHPKQGLIWPDDYEDEILAGSYFGRRYNHCGKDLESCISVERAEFYGFRKGYYIVVGGLYAQKEGKQALKRYRRTEPSAYLKDTVVYLGCIH